MLLFVWVAIGYGSESTRCYLVHSRVPSTMYECIATYGNPSLGKRLLCVCVCNAIETLVEEEGRKIPYAWYVRGMEIQIGLKPWPPARALVLWAF